MRTKPHIAYILFVISILMPIIPVMPHHHHTDGVICMKNDISSDCCGGHHHETGNDHCCNDECVTMHFFEQLPGSDETWNYHYTPEVITLFFESVVPLVLLFDTGNNIHTPPYIERLHGTRVPRAIALRAPPALLA